MNTTMRNVNDMINEAISLSDSVINYINFQFLSNADILRDRLKDSGKINDSDVETFDMMMKEPFKKQIGRLRKMKRILLVLSGSNILQCKESQKENSVELQEQSS